MLGTEDAESLELFGTGPQEPQRLALRREATQRKIHRQLEPFGLRTSLMASMPRDLWREADVLKEPKRAKSCPKLPSWGLDAQ